MNFNVRSVYYKVHQGTFKFGHRSPLIPYFPVKSNKNELKIHSLLEILNYLPDGGHFSGVPMRFWIQDNTFSVVRISVVFDFPRMTVVGRLTKSHYRNFALHWGTCMQNLPFIGALARKICPPLGHLYVTKQDSWPKSGHLGPDGSAIALAADPLGTYVKSQPILWSIAIGA